MNNFERLLNQALFEDIEPSNMTPSAGAVPTAAPAMQKNSASQQQAQNLYQQYQRAKQEADKAENEAATKQDIGLFNKAASSRKRMESLFQAYQLAMQSANGQNPTKDQTNSMPADSIQ